MAKLHEYQGKEILRKFDIKVPKGFTISNAEELSNYRDAIGDDIVLKGQSWVTGRAALGLIQFPLSEEEAKRQANNLFGTKIGQSVIETVLVEEKLNIEREFYTGIIIDDQSQAPVMIFSSRGGSGVEEISELYPESISRTIIDVSRGLREYEARDLIRKTGIRGKLQSQLAGFLVKLYQAASTYHARAAEINPVVLTKEGDLFAADCRLTIDDNAIYKFPELGIEVAREFDRPPTRLEKIAWDVEKNDYRGTFFFIQMEDGFEMGEGFIGFHGAGGGGSMMSMDAVMNQGFHLANFVDTSGNPPASKVYRAARIILAQRGIDGYFASGSGVASQEQFHSARGLVKAFMEVPLNVPAVIRLGGNAEDIAIRILERARSEIAAPLEGYGKDDTPEFCAARLRTLVDEYQPPVEQMAPAFVNDKPHSPDYEFQTVTGGTIFFDYERCAVCQTKICIEKCVPQILELKEGLPVLKISPEEARRGKCIECLACEIECYFDGNRGGRISLPIAGLEVE